MKLLTHRGDKMYTVDEFQNNKIKLMTEELFNGIGIYDINVSVFRDPNPHGRGWYISIYDNDYNRKYGAIVVSKWMSSWDASYILIDQSIRDMIDVEGIEKYISNYINKNIK